MTAVMAAALCGFVSLGVDLGRVQLAKSELQTAADAAARAAANALEAGVSAARLAAQGAAADNTCDGVPVSLTPATDLSFGSWDSSSRTFVSCAAGQESSATALRVSLRRSSTDGIPLLFGSVLGRSRCGISATAIATVTSTAGSGVGFVGLSGMEFKNLTGFQSYKSSQTTYPNLLNSGDKCIVQTNGVLSVKHLTWIRGDLKLGPGGSTCGQISVTGSRTNLPSPVAVSSMPEWNPSPNPGGIPQNYTVSRSTTLPGGTYWFTALDVDRDLSFSGPATIYVNGNVAIDSDLTAFGRIPGNLKIYVLGNNRSFGDKSANHVDIVAVIHAPGADAVFKNDADFYGSAVFNRIEGKNGTSFYYDETLGTSASGGKIIAMVK